MSDHPQLSQADLHRWLTASGDAQQELFRRARAVRRETLGDEVMLRGVIEISNYCQKRCDYCAMRAPSKIVDRYRLKPAQILEVVGELKRHRITTAFLQAGQDPRCDELLEEVIPVIKWGLGMHVLLCLGERPRHVYQRFAELGADSYILKFETSDPQLYQAVVHAPPERRLQCIRWIQEAGLKLGTGNIVGLPGQTLQSLVADIEFALELEPNFVSSAPLIPNEGTPFEHAPVGDLDLTLNTMALWRILLRAPLIPAVSALEKFGALAMHDVHFPTTDGRELVFARYTQPEPEQELLLAQLGLRLPAQSPPRITAKREVDL